MRKERLLSFIVIFGLLISSCATMINMPKQADPVITKNPTDIYLCASDLEQTFEFRVIATGDNLTYNWVGSMGGVEYNMTDWPNVKFNSAEDVLSVSAVIGETEVSITVEVCNDYGCVESTPAVLRVVDCSGGYTIEASVEGGGGTISPSGTVSVEEGIAQRFTITNDPGFKFYQILIDGQLLNPAEHAKVSQDGYYTLSNVTEKHTIVVRFRDSYALRDKGPAGGLISYVNSKYATDGWKYIETAPSDYSDTQYAWSSVINVAVGTGDLAGAGEANTIAIINQHGVTGSSAAQLCESYFVSFSGKTYDDWFLPSKADLASMYDNLKKGFDLGFFDVSAYYWSSSEYSIMHESDAWVLNFNIGEMKSGGGKQHVAKVRCVRYFL